MFHMFCRIAITHHTSVLRNPPACAASPTLLPRRLSTTTKRGVACGVGSLLVAPLQDVLAQPPRWGSLRALFTPSATTSLAQCARTCNYLVLRISDDVRARLRFWRYDGDGVWHETTPDGGAEGGVSGGSGLVPAGEDVRVSAVWPDDSDDLWVQRDGYLVPDSLEV